MKFLKQALYVHILLLSAKVILEKLDYLFNRDVGECILTENRVRTHVGCQEATIPFYKYKFMMSFTISFREFVYLV